MIFLLLSTHVIFLSLYFPLASAYFRQCIRLQAIFPAVERRAFELLFAEGFRRDFRRAAADAFAAHLLLIPLPPSLPIFPRFIYAITSL